MKKKRPASAKVKHGLSGEQLEVAKMALWNLQQDIDADVSDGNRRYANHIYNLRQRLEKNHETLTVKMHGTLTYALKKYPTGKYDSKTNPLARL